MVAENYNWTAAVEASDDKVEVNSSSRTYMYQSCFCRRAHELCLSVAVPRDTRMRRSVSLSIAMASSLGVCRLHMRGRGGLVKSLRRVQTFIHRNTGTVVAAADGDPLRKEATGQFMTRQTDQVSLLTSHNASSLTWNKPHSKLHSEICMFRVCLAIIQNA